MKRWPRGIVIGLLQAYRAVVSPVLHAICGPGCGCRFHPTCSRYGIEAVRSHGAFRGLWLLTKRIARCHPFSSGGEDPVPPVGSPRKEHYG